MKSEELHSYDHYIITWSGGKDSAATILHLLDKGVNPSKMELWHHDIDGRHINKKLPIFMDWPVTPAYCAGIADALGLPLYVSWREGGFYREMNRFNRKTKPVWFEMPNEKGEAICVKLPTKLGKHTTRHKFPQVSSNLQVRWCSSSLKIDVFRRALNNQKRFRNKKVLVISGERRQESPNRARYNEFEVDVCDARGGRVNRHVDRWRPIIDWQEKEVWETLRRFRLQPHPAYHLGYGRLSCQFCIFGSKNQWRTNQIISPDRFNKIARVENNFGYTIHPKSDVITLADRGTSYDTDPFWVNLALSESWYMPSVVPQELEWELPAGAFGENAGPT